LFISCSQNSIKSRSVEESFKKICLNGSGSGRLEFNGHKFSFSYEAEINRQKNEFVLGLDFPVIGEKQVVISLNPSEALKSLNRGTLYNVLKNEIDSDALRKQKIEALEEFFVVTSEFINWKSNNQFPTQFVSQFENEHFVLKREHGNYFYEVDAFYEGDLFYKRIILKNFQKKSNKEHSEIVLFLTSDSCS
jgi:hypothetical protein